jgi:hypothetical protein
MYRHPQEDSTMSLTLPIPHGKQHSPINCGSTARFRVGRISLIASVLSMFSAVATFAGSRVEPRPFKVLPPIVRGNLALFPVVADHAYDTSQLITLDEGIRNGQVTVTEAGEERGLVRPGQSLPPRSGGAEVNRLVLNNNSSRPLLLLAGEIVTGGKQDRVIGADRIVPPGSGPIDLGVFCVEPGRWVASSSSFGSMGVQMAQPSVRTPAMAEHNQSSVWANVGASNARMAKNLSAPEAAALPTTTSYAKIFASPPVAKMVAQYGGVEGEQAILRELRSNGAVGVVVAVDRQVVWADVFASTDLLARYWPKLFHSYVAEAMTSGKSGGAASLHDAEVYMNNLSGGREIDETEPGVFRRSDVTGEGFRLFELTSLLPQESFVVHITKMLQDLEARSSKPRVY